MYLAIDPLHVGVTVGAITGTATTLGAYILDVDPVAVGVAVGAICGGLAAVITAVGTVLVAMATKRQVTAVAVLTDSVVAKQDTAAKQTAEIHSATNGTLGSLQRDLVRLEERLVAALATVADRDATIVKATETAAQIAAAAPTKKE